MRKITVYETKDGVRFDTMEEAFAYEKEDKLALVAVDLMGGIESPDADSGLIIPVLAVEKAKMIRVDLYQTRYGVENPSERRVWDDSTLSTNLRRLVQIFASSFRQSDDTYCRTNQPYFAYNRMVPENLSIATTTEETV